MHADKKVAFGLGILVVGIVGALFFRNENSIGLDTPELRNAEQLDRRIAENEIAPYLESDPKSGDAADASTGNEQKYFELPASLGVDQEHSAFAGPVPNPIPYVDETGTSDDVVLGPPVDQMESGHPDSPIGGLIDAHDGTQGGDYELYEVRSGDTLSGIAHRFFGSSSRYQLIFDANRDTLRSPDDLRPDMMLRIPQFADGARQARDSSLPRLSTRGAVTAPPKKRSLPPDGGSNRVQRTRDTSSGSRFDQRRRL